MASDETEGFERLQQRRQHGHDVVYHGLAHRLSPPAHPVDDRERDLGINEGNACENQTAFCGRG
jgi:hypothetical protein